MLATDRDPKFNTPCGEDPLGNMMNSNVYDRLLPNGADDNRIVMRDDRGVSWTRSDMMQLVDRIAGVFEGAGVQPGDRVGGKIDKSVPSFCVYLATLKVGAVWLPMNTAYTAAETNLIVDDAQPKLVISPNRIQDQRFISYTMGADGSGSLMDAAIQDGRQIQTVDRKPTDLAAILYTSGTTGRPKGAMITHENLAFCASSLAEAWGVTSDDILIHALPTFHAHGLFIAANTMLFADGTMFFLPKFDAQEVVSLIPQATMFMGVPTLYTRLLANSGLTAGLCEKFRLFVSGSAPLSADTFQEFEARTGHRILERYGMTETTIVTSNPLAGERKPSSVGFPLPGVSVRARSAEGEDLAPGQVGELVVRGPNVFKGYWNMPEKTADEFTPDGYFESGDLVRIDEDGRVWIVGRAKDLIITGGYNVYPREVESALNSIEGVQDSAVVGVQHPDFGEGVVAVVELKDSSSSFDARSAIAMLGEQLAKYKVPKEIFVLQSLPRNAMGKIQKDKLREQFSSAFLQRA